MKPEDRFNLRLELEACGSEVVGYNGPTFQLHIARGKFADVLDLATKRGLTFKNCFYFPLGTDNPPDDMRHWCGPYTPENGFPRPGFWLYANFDAPTNIVD